MSNYQPRWCNSTDHSFFTSRRNFLQVGALGTLGLTLGDVFKAQAYDAYPSKEGKAKNVINIYLPGGMAHQESFDPKMYAPIEYRGPMGTVKTKLDGVYFSELMKETAKVADKITVVRSMTHGEAAHERGTHNMMTGVRPSPALVYPSFGSVVSHELGPRNNLPPYVAIPSVTANGGTGLTAFTSGGAVYATSTSALTTGTLPASSGGTGVNNGTNTLTLAGNMTLSGAFATTLTVTGTTAVTLPTTGTLATTANTVASFSAGTTGLTPSTSTTGAVTLGGTLAVASGGTGQTTASGAFNALSPITSTGDLILGNGVNSATRLPIGANTYVLTSNGTTASWAAPTGSTGPLIYNTTTISSNQTVVAGQNALSVGPMTINSGSTVTVASGQRWLVL